MDIFYYIESLEVEYRHSDLVRGDLEFDQEFLTYIPIGTTCYHIMRKTGTIIFEESSLTDKHLDTVINHFIENDSILYCKKLVRGNAKTLEISDCEISDILSAIDAAKLKKEKEMRIS